MYHHLLTKARGEYWRQRPDKRLDHPPQRATVQEPSVIKDKFGRPQEDLLVVHCFCTCGAGELSSYRVGRSVEREFMSVLSYRVFRLTNYCIYIRTFVCYIRFLHVLSLTCYRATFASAVLAMER